MGDARWQAADGQMPGRTSRDYDSPAQPEILPPGSMPERDYGYGQRPAPPAPRAQRPGWRVSPATYLLLSINIAVFLLMVVSGVSATSPSTLQLVHWGANFGAVRITENSPVIGVLAGDWWRLVTAAFVHAGILHIGLNMWCLWNLGLLGESLLGGFGLFATYVLTGVMGNLLTIGVDPGSVEVGASGAVFGIAGVLIMLLGSPRLSVDRGEVKRLRRSVIYFAAINLVLGFGTNLANGPIKVGNMAHLGGFLCGLALGLPLVPRIGAERSLWRRRQWIAYGGMLLVILLGARFVISLRHG